MAGKDWAYSRKTQVQSTSANKDIEARMIDRKESNWYGNWEGKVGRIQILDNL